MVKGQSSTSKKIVKGHVLKPGLKKKRVTVTRETYLNKGSRGHTSSRKEIKQVKLLMAQEDNEQKLLKKACLPPTRVSPRLQRQVALTYH